MLIVLSLDRAHFIPVLIAKEHFLFSKDAYVRGHKLCLRLRLASLKPQP